ncbi:unnamed protein product [Didymodactylos carnosus]|uniref:Uncharacterized protein n=1 Tax=Didymodactylos carnosus TaxID=1234261 RepID=A0A814EEB2_9BILA|nr:unnamed protein product [Didymodactylos carnosus]CAF0966213.1 unnamed protein product [Didymodactylos carnosus]CAF3564450.1 unnamed protein product [Didymodactylos carnosus]CAF3739736.1 unnamed protein product [Didymodactylos carnosus]
MKAGQLDGAGVTAVGLDMPVRSHDLYKSRPRYNQDMNRDIVASRSGYITKHVQEVLKVNMIFLIVLSEA